MQANWHFNTQYCGGKHAGMLALAKHLGKGIKGYTNKEHQSKGHQ